MFNDRPDWWNYCALYRLTGNCYLFIINLKCIWFIPSESLRVREIGDFRQRKSVQVLLAHNVSGNLGNGSNDSIWRALPDVLRPRLHEIFVRLGKSSLSFDEYVMWFLVHSQLIWPDVGNSQKRKLKEPLHMLLPPYAALLWQPNLRTMTQ